MCVCVCELEPLLPVHCLVIPLACCVSPTTMFTFPDGIIFTCEWNSAVQHLSVRLPTPPRLVLWANFLFISRRQLPWWASGFRLSSSLLFQREQFNLTCPSSVPGLLAALALRTDHDVCHFARPFSTKNGAGGRVESSCMASCTSGTWVSLPGQGWHRKCSTPSSCFEESL